MTRYLLCVSPPASKEFISGRMNGSVSSPLFLRPKEQNICLWWGVGGGGGGRAVTPSPSYNTEAEFWTRKSLRFLGIILRVLILEVSVYNVYITNQFKTTFAQGRGGGYSALVEMTVNSKKENSLEFCPSYVQEFGLSTTSYSWFVCSFNERTETIDSVSSF